MQQRQVPPADWIEATGCTNLRVEDNDSRVTITATVDADGAAEASLFLYLNGTPVRRIDNTDLPKGTHQWDVSFDTGPLDPGEYSVGFAAIWNLAGSTAPTSPQVYCGSIEIPTDRGGGGGGGVVATGCGSASYDDSEGRVTIDGFSIKNNTSQRQTVTQWLYLNGTPVSEHTNSPQIDPGEEWTDVSWGTIGTGMASADGTRFRFSLEDGFYDVGLAARADGESPPSSPDVTCGTIEVGSDDNGNGDPPNGGNGGEPGIDPVVLMVIAVVLAGVGIWAVNR